MNIVPGVLKNMLSACPEVLVQLQFHAAIVVGILIPPLGLTFSAESSMLVV